MNKDINVLYQFTDSPEGSNYKVLQLFSDEGPLPEKLINSVLRSFDEKTGGDIQFTSIEQLGRFCIELLKESSGAEAFLLSVQDYNIGLESCNNTESFKELFRRYGTSIQNPDSNIKKNSLLSKIFN